MTFHETNVSFLSGGGEMAELIRNYDWGATSLGVPSTWPSALKLTLRLVLTSRQPMVVWWGHDLIQLYNDAYRKSLGFERHPAALGQKGRECWSDLWQVIGPQIDTVFAGLGSTWNERQPIETVRNGKRQTNWWTYGYSPIEENGQVAGILAVCNDVTNEQLILNELRASDERLKVGLELSGNGVWEWDIPGNAVHFSRTWYELLGYQEAAEVDGMAFLRMHVHPDDRTQALEAAEKFASGQAATYSTELRVKSADGNWKWLLSRGVAVEHDSERSRVKVLGTSVDISDKRESREQLWRQANYDELTGLPNRRLFKEHLDYDVRKASRSGSALSVLFIDLDHFKDTNDLYGHECGDAILKKAGARIASCTRASDCAGRLGGDRFSVILNDVTEHSMVSLVAQKIIDTLARPFQIGAETIHLSASIGITMYSADASKSEELLRNAERALHAAKSFGRNQFSFFTPFMQHEAVQRSRLLADLRRAVNSEQLQVYYQPIVDLQTGTIHKAEALLRWFHPSLGPISPNQFIPLAEESGLINEIGDWVFVQAATCADVWSRRLNAPFQISVNRSPVQFTSRAAVLDWPLHLHANRQSGASISIEITEGVLMQTSPRISEQLMAYRSAGMALALDDFGTGYSSLAYLQRFELDYLKIDRSFVCHMASKQSDLTIIRSIILMAHELGLKVIAEGIETLEQYELLRTAKCDYGQGFLFSPAVPAEKLDELLMPGLSIIGPT